MPKIDIGVGQEFPLEEKRRDGDCAGRADYHHRFSHWFSRGRHKSPREDTRTQPDPKETGKD